VIVVALLLLLYRAPLMAVIPLATVYVAVQIALHSLALLAGAGMLTLDRDNRIFITVLSYGAGVDYCLFLIARYREGLVPGADAATAVVDAVGKVGGALAASAGTVICGIGTLAFARFGKYHQAGVCIPLSLIVVLASALTFTPALLRIAGSWAFWPTRPAESDAERSRRWGASNIWEKIAQALLARPGTIWLLSMAVMAPFVLVGVLHYQQVDYGLSDALPKEAPSTTGTAVLKEHFPAGMVGPVTVLLTNDDVYFGTVESYALIKTVSANLERQQDTLQLADIRSLAYPFGITRYGKEILTSITVSTPPASGEAIRHSSFRHYVSTERKFAGHVTWIDLVSKIDPLSEESIGNFGRLESAFRDALPAELEQSQLDFVGPTANLRDLEDVTRGDFQRIQIMVPAAVFLILLVVARSLVVSLYLIGSVVVSFLATLGVTFLVFWALSPAGFIGLDWKVPVFLFTILMAVGEDYNILLLTRVREEQAEHGVVRGVTAALVKTGGVISSCGFIMAGTFAALLSGALIEMKQLGFALAFGILLDTLVVRSLLVPAFLIWMWGKDEA
jgi:RND superfamily putative drug exporter